MELKAIANSVLDTAESTNDLAKRLGEAGFPHGTWISARVQTAGRGRAGRRWESQEGNLFLSVIARDPKKELWTWIPLVTGCATASVLRALFPTLDLRIKWPNDLWIKRDEGFAKVGGILCEASSFVVIGLGLNCASFPDVDQPTTSLSEALGRKITADDVRAAIIAELLHRLAELSEQGPAQTAADFAHWSALPEGTEIEWGKDGRGTVLGLGESGELRVRSDQGEVRVYAEDVRVRPSSP
jgi:BirA family biotin operon repressor/biotin-[acetyl-CoA-carboxylase] ligase